jgi:hypothetical protein
LWQLHPGGVATHVDPPQSELDAIETEYKVSCETNQRNCALSEARYASLVAQGHSRDEVDCFMAEGERNHNEQHGGPNDHMNRGPNDDQTDQRDRQAMEQVRELLRSKVCTSPSKSPEDDRKCRDAREADQRDRDNGGGDSSQ